MAIAADSPELAGAIEPSPSVASLRGLDEVNLLLSSPAKLDPTEHWLCMPSRAIRYRAELPGSWQNGSKMFTTRSRDASDTPTTMIGLAVTLAFSLVAFTMPTSVWAAGPTLTVSADGGVHTLYRDDLLARSDVVEITTSRDVAYRTPRTYRAAPLAKLLEGIAIPPEPS
jgi:hypothetical protein